MQIQDTMVSLGDGVSVEARRIRHNKPSGPTLVFLHESLGSIALWRRFPEQLAEATGLDALVFNRLGYGRSSDEVLPRPYDYLQQHGEHWLPRLLDTLAIDQVVLVGHSDGGSIALFAAGALGERVRALVTMAAHTYADHLTLKGIRDMTVKYRETDLRDKLWRYHGARTDELFTAWHTVWLDEAFQRHLDFSGALAAITCPSLIIQGDNDEYGLPQQVTDIAEGIGDTARAVFMADTGHAPHLEKPAQVGDLICDFLPSELARKSAVMS
ncbi:alpha/beta hydrolase [Marinobacter salinisoli]|uniref:Alpha/beta hydrolase n=1 Tax=Marinobacter salinisoli TaxID=2769486 RepID=A0ABX7MPL7_9GAMM|nr:alpha/beta hydrolase [Marinobacter salinisoli]QSP93314.1 alpha/beta hydrolase [Marinobacter salinisoli]